MPLTAGRAQRGLDDSILRRPRTAKYWVIALDPEYKWSIVGEPGRRYLWILSRTPTLDDALYRRLVTRVSYICYPKCVCQAKSATTMPD